MANEVRDGESTPDGGSPRYLPIGGYGAIGDCRTAALVAPNGSIDWLCMPHFDSPAIFCRLLDAERGGYFRLAPVSDAEGSMAYLPDTNILETTFKTETGRLRLLDFMPIRPRQPSANPLTRVGALFSRPSGGLAAGMERELGNDVAAAHRVNRIATCLEGEVAVEMTLKVTFDYARRPPRMLERVAGARGTGAILTDGERYLALAAHATEAASGSRAAFDLQGDADLLRLRASLSVGHGLVAMLNYARSASEARNSLQRLFDRPYGLDLDETQAYWQGWTAKCVYTGTYQEAVKRSALTLKLCTFEPTGAIVAAPTTSLPEAVGGVRNWDYRYTWLRDSSFTIDALGRLGYYDEARDYLHFLHDLQIKSGDELHIMYGIRGESGDQLREVELEHLEGYDGSRPVRIGNGAANQRQLDVYGELLNAAYLYSTHEMYRRGRRVGPARDLKRLTTVIAEYVVAHWRDLDRGIWEVRGEPRAFVYSRAMCWVALDRARRLASLSGSNKEADRWSETAAQIRADVLAHGYDQQLDSFLQAYGSEALPALDTALDAANLRIPLVDFVPWDATEARGTISATMRALAAPRALLYRYRSIDAAGNPTAGQAGDGLPGMEGGFLACAFWLVEALCYVGEIEEARQRFEELLSLAGSLGLFAEEVDVATGALLGNYPQAYTHIGLISCAVTLQRAQEGTLTSQTTTHDANDANRLG